MVDVKWKELIFSTNQDLMSIQEEYNFPKRIVSSLQDDAEIAHIRLHDDLTYLMLNFPYEPIGSGNNVTRAVAVVIRNNVVYFISHSSVGISDFFKTFDEQPPEHIAHIISGFFLYMLDSFSTILAHTETTIAEMERKLFRKPKNELIEHLLHIQKGMIHFKVAIVGFENILSTISTRHPKLLWDDSSDYEYTTIMIETSQVKTSIHVIDELISSTISVADSIYANNMSRTMQTLTSLTIVISVPTLVASVYGMNIALPFQNHPAALQIVMLVTILLTVGVTYYLYKKEWF